MQILFVLGHRGTIRHLFDTNSSHQKKSPSGSCRTGKTINRTQSRSRGISLEIPLNLGTNQPALVGVGVGIRGRSKSAGVATFLNRSGSAFPRIAPNRVCREYAKLRTGIIAALWLDRWSDREYAHLSAAAQSSGIEGAWMHILIGVHLPTPDIICPDTVDLGLDCYIIRKPDDRPRTNLVHITRGRSVLEDEIGRSSVCLERMERVYESFFLTKTVRVLVPESPDRHREARVRIPNEYCTGSVGTHILDRLSGIDNGTDWERRIPD